MDIVWLRQVLILSRWLEDDNVSKGNDEEHAARWIIGLC